MDNNAKKLWIALAIIVVIVGLVGAWYGLMYVPKKEAEEKARKEQLAKKAAAEKKKKQKARAAKKKADYKKLIEQGDSEFEEENWQDAQSSYSDALSLFPNEQYPQDQLTLISDKLLEIEESSKEGVVEVISSVTDRYYVVVSSSIDSDLAMDYANKIAAEGQRVKLLEPYGKRPYYRVAVADYDTVEEAENASTSFDAMEGDHVWVLRY